MDRHPSQRPPCFPCPRTHCAGVESFIFLDSPRSCRARGCHISYSSWLMEGNPTNICSVTNCRERLVAKYAWQQPGVELNDGLQAPLSWNFFWVKSPIWTNPFLFRVMHSVHSSTKLDGVGHSFLWPLEKGKWRLVVFPTQSLSVIPLKQPHPNFPGECFPLPFVHRANRGTSWATSVMCIPCRNRERPHLSRFSALYAF